MIVVAAITTLALHVHITKTAMTVLAVKIVVATAVAVILANAAVAIAAPLVIVTAAATVVVCSVWSACSARRMSVLSQLLGMPVQLI